MSNLTIGNSVPDDSRPAASAGDEVPCPFCGSPAVAIHPNDIASAGCEMGVMNVDVFYAHCDGCGAEGPQQDSHGDAVKAWNRRAGLPSASVVIAGDIPNSVRCAALDLRDALLDAGEQEDDCERIAHFLSRDDVRETMAG